MPRRAPERGPSPAKTATAPWRAAAPAATATSISSLFDRVEETTGVDPFGVWLIVEPYVSARRVGGGSGRAQVVATSADVSPLALSA